MEFEIVKQFENKHVKLVLKNKFYLFGTIEKVSETTIIFSTDQATSAIQINDIISIIDKGDNGE